MMETCTSERPLDMANTTFDRPDLARSRAWMTWAEVTGQRMWPDHAVLVRIAGEDRWRSPLVGARSECGYGSQAPAHEPTGGVPRQHRERAPPAGAQSALHVWRQDMAKRPTRRFRVRRCAGAHGCGRPPSTVRDQPWACPEELATTAVLEAAHEKRTKTRCQPSCHGRLTLVR